MAANISPIFVLTINNKGITFVNADGTSTKDLFVAGSNGSRVASIAATTTDTSNNIIHLYAYDGSTAYLVGEITVPLASGTDGTTAAVNLLSLAMCPWLNSDGSITLPTGWKLQASVNAAVTTAKTLTLVALGADY
jgi:hypothetical protein